MRWRIVPPFCPAHLKILHLAVNEVEMLELTAELLLENSAYRRLDK